MHETCRKYFFKSSNDAERNIGVLVVAWGTPARMDNELFQRRAIIHQCFPIYVTCKSYYYMVMRLSCVYSSIVSTVRTRNLSVIDKCTCRNMDGVSTAMVFLFLISSCLTFANYKIWTAFRNHVKMEYIKIHKKFSLARSKNKIQNETVSSNINCLASNFSTSFLLLCHTNIFETLADVIPSSTSTFSSSALYQNRPDSLLSYLWECIRQCLPSTDIPQCINRRILQQHFLSKLQRGCNYLYRSNFSLLQMHQSVHFVSKKFVCVKSVFYFRKRPCIHPADPVSWSLDCSRYELDDKVFGAVHFYEAHQHRKRQIVLSASVCLLVVSMNLQCCLCAEPPSALLIYFIRKLGFY